MNDQPRVLILVRDGCHLCEQAVAVVDAVCAESGAEYALEMWMPTPICSGATPTRCR